MSTAELKKKVIAQINNIGNDELLSEILAMLHIESRSVGGVYQMSEAEQEAVEDGIKQMENGQSISHEESNKRVREWLNAR